MGAGSGNDYKKSYFDNSDDATIARDIEYNKRNKDIGLDAIVEKEVTSKGQKNFNKLLIGTLILTSSFSAGSYISSKFLDAEKEKIAEDAAAYALLASIACGAVYCRDYILTGINKR